MDEPLPIHQLVGWDCDGRQYRYHCRCGHSVGEWYSPDDAQLGYLIHEQLHH